MDVAARSRTWVENVLADLDRRYDSFAVNQRTVELGAESYRRAREQFEARRLDSYLELRNDAQEILHLLEGDRHSLPRRCAPDDDVLADGLRELVQDRTPLECRVDDLEAITILGVRPADDPETDPVYHPLPVFRGRRTAGHAGGEAVWRGSRGAIHPSYG